MSKNEDLPRGRKLNQPVTLSPKAQEIVLDAQIDKASRAVNESAALKAVTGLERVETIGEAEDVTRVLGNANRQLRKESMERARQWKGPRP